jgi:hypothetical protein
MSLFYVEENDENTRELFYKRMIYKGDLIGLDKMNVIDFNLGEKFLYGRVDRAYIPMMLQRNNPNMVLKDYQSPSPGEPLQGVNFVVDAFNQMSLEFVRCTANGQIDPSDKYLSSLRVYKAFQDPHRLYSSYVTSYFDSLQDHWTKENIIILDFDHFIIELMYLLEKSLREMPFTFSAFMKSKWCPINATGLAVEIADLSCANDQAKIEQFVASPNWEFYVNACDNYGFMIDQNVPWRIVSDIASPTCLADQYGFQTTEEIINFGYESVPPYYFSRFRHYLLNLYNRVKATNALVTEECADKLISSVKVAKSYSPDELAKLYSDDYFLKLYFKIRFLEEEFQLQPFEQSNIVDDALELFRARSVETALFGFESIINKTFDSAGSLSYNIKHQKALRESGDEVGEELLRQADIAAAWEESGVEEFWVPVSSRGIGLDIDPGAND